jgi:hypothetical protein
VAVPVLAAGEDAEDRERTISRKLTRRRLDDERRAQEVEDLGPDTW